MSNIIKLVLFVIWAGLWTCVDAQAAPVCGDGRREGVEECDDGSQNSDSRPDACRTDCTKARCGDDVKDSREECDDGRANNDKIPDACRTNCKNAHCGDGVLDSEEECDDQNKDAYDGCNRCKRCYSLKDDLVFSGLDYSEARLCPGRYEISDSGQEGVLIIDSSFMTLDCQGATIVGVVKTSGPLAHGFRKKGGQPAAYSHTGVGIVIKGQDVVLRNCRVEGFKTGVKLQSTGAVLFDDALCNNLLDIQAVSGGNYGVKNSCTKVENWQENGQSGCSSRCN
jgi:cysteine-rich repeat protein